MKNKITNFFKKNSPLLAFIAGFLFTVLIKAGLDYTSSDTFCNVCHAHPHSTITWKQSTHKDTKSGTVVQCVECHLPPGGLAYFTEKMKSGTRDLFATVFKDVSKINWDLKSRREYAVRFTYKKSCIHCHQNLFSKGLSEKGQNAHLYYEQNSEKLRCINCHLEVGHYHEKPVETIADDEKSIGLIIFSESTKVDSFVNFVEKIPGTSVNFEMVAIPVGTFLMGSSENEPYQDEDESPRVKVQISQFWMGKAEVSWDEYEAFIKQMGFQGRTEYLLVSRNLVSKMDAITGPTPAYGNPDQGWGKGKRPAITMTHYGATKYCEWLSSVTGKHYRLPTEAEWEYAARANSEGAYFFEGDPRKFTQQRFWNKIFGADTSVINSHVIYAGNSKGMTYPPDRVQPNPFGLVNMLGNVKEFCSDWYSPGIYSVNGKEDIVVNPTGEDQGKEYVIRGGSFKSDAINVRVSDRDHTQSDAWMVTDPQMPKSRWWYSDVTDVGFRVVCVYNPFKISNDKK
ncbi:MAG: SUMF1/EgtB/PvdO family nonheme iron enzyme [bacterium]|nr:MAG: SUMF1/EgtB/PvdO family nonheme iron enzyme [bacterium]